MDEELKKAVQKPTATTQEPHPRERTSFKAFLLSNPNYFGNLAASPFEPVVSIASNTHYEELACVGYQPQQKRLEGVVHVYQPSGYGTGICGAGTPEYVRFYLSPDQGATWEDQGLTGFQAYNVPQGTEGAKRLEYAVSLAVDPARRLCFFDSLVRVRAILSWNDPPPAGQPDWQPVWGNVREATIQVEPRRAVIFSEVFDLAKAKLPPAVADVLDLEAPIQTTARALGTAELAELYRDKDVPVHRFAHKELASYVSGGLALSAESFAATVPGIKITPDLLGALLKTDGDTSFEELRCVGLDPNLPDTLVGVIQVKKSSGYSGGPCTRGSREYVTFWGDFDGNGSFDTCLGTAGVTVHDLNNVPRDGVHYAVRLPVDLQRYRQPCTRGPRLVRIRAILSWNTPAPCADPQHVPTWGNREETVIHLTPGSAAPGGRIAILGGIPVSHINPGTGLTTPTAVFATNNLPPDSLGRPCPFGGRVTVQGAPVADHSYVVEVSQDGVVWTPVLTDLVLTDELGNTSIHKADPVTRRFAYRPFTKNLNSVLAQWDSTGDARWTVRLSVFDAAGNPQGTDSRVVQLDNTRPEASIVITTGAGNCGKFPSGSVLSGTFVARDLYFGGYSLRVQPGVNPPGAGVPAPASGIVQTAPAPGAPWTLDTRGMRSCGYVISVSASDRAIVDSQHVGHPGSHSVGFCLEAEGEPVG